MCERNEESGGYRQENQSLNPSEGKAKVAMTDNPVCLDHSLRPPLRNFCHSSVAFFVDDKYPGLNFAGVEVDERLHCRWPAGVFRPEEALNHRQVQKFCFTQVHARGIDSLSCHAAKLYPWLGPQEGVPVVEETQRAVEGANSGPGFLDGMPEDARTLTNPGGSGFEAGIPERGEIEGVGKKAGMGEVIELFLAAGKTSTGFWDVDVSHSTCRRLRRRSVEE